METETRDPTVVCPGVPGASHNMHIMTHFFQRKTVFCLQANLTQEH